jgi:hypothetical protein
MPLSRFLLPTLSLLFSLSLAAQATRDPDAVTAVQGAIAALGGDAAIAQVQNWRAQGQATGVKQSGGTDGTITWEKAGSEFRSELVTNGRSNAIVSGGGQPASVAGTVVNSLPTYVAKTLFLPALVASTLRNDFQNPNSSIRYVGRSVLNSKPVIVVRTATKDPADSYVIGRTWYLDASTNLPVRVEYGAPSAGTLLVWFQCAAEFSDYRSIAGVQYPFHIVTYQQGRQVQTITLASVDPSATISPTDFSAPAGGAQ